MSIMTALSLAGAAGLNAYIPLLVFGLLARCTDLVDLPPEWLWLTHPVLLGVVAALLVVELVADKIPVVDSVNDVIQTVVRPTSGGIVFASGLGAAEVVDGRTEINWVAVIAGVLIALAIHLLKSTARPVVNASTAGVGAPVLSTVEDTTSLTVTLLALLAPGIAAALMVAAVAALGVLGVRRIR
ncbi:DUF4126 family protein [Corynebacterium doosanense]